MVDFKRITAESSLYTFHAHTQFCDGRDTMEAIVASCVEHSFTHIGFSPHSPIPFHSPCNMSYDVVPDYLSEISRLQELYGNRITILKSMEIDFTTCCGPSDDYYQQLPLDYRIGSVHFLPARDDSSLQIDIDGHPDEFVKKVNNYFHRDIDYVVRSYFDQSMLMVEKGGFDIIGHFDKIGFNASNYKPGIDTEPWFDDLVGQLFEAIKASGVAVEINTKAWQPYGRFFPSVRYFKMLKESGLPIVVNSDAHVAALVNAGRNEAYRLLSEA